MKEDATHHECRKDERAEIESLLGHLELLSSAPKSLSWRISSSILRDGCVVALSENLDSLRDLRLALSKNA